MEVNPVINLGNLRLLLQEGEEDLIEVEVADNLAICREVSDLKIMIVMVTKMGIITREVGIVLLEIEDKAEEILEVLCMVKVEEEVDLTKVQMSDVQK